MYTYWEMFALAWFPFLLTVLYFPQFFVVVWVLLRPVIGLFVICFASLLRLADKLIGMQIRRVRAAIGYGLRLAPFILLELLLSLLRRAPATEERLKVLRNAEYDLSFYTKPPPPDPYVQALALLGVAQDCSEPALKAAYRAAIRKAHPDAGGSAEAAQAVFAAHDLIRQRKGWESKRVA